MPESGFLLAEDEAVKAKASGITVSDSKNATRPVPVRFRFPSTDVADASRYPYIIIEQHSIVQDPTKNHVGPVATKVDPSTAVLDENSEWETEYPLPVRLFYHVVSHAISHQHHAQITAAMVRPDRFPLHNGWLYIPATEDFTVMHVLGHQRDAVRSPENQRVLRTTVPVYVEARLLKTEIRELAAVVQTTDLTVDERTDG